MENHLPAQTMTLSMNIDCCERCPKVLKKKLLKMPGVETVAIDTENNLVFVTGTVSPKNLLNDVAKLGKTVEMLPTDTIHRTNHGKYNNFCTQQKGKTHKNCCCQDDRHSHKKKLEEDEHRCEPYVPVKIDPRLCRDFYCKTHPMMRKIVDRVPAESSSLFGIGGLRFNGGYPVYPRWYGEEPPRFEYGRRMLPQYPFGFH